MDARASANSGKSKERTPERERELEKRRAARAKERARELKAVVPLRYSVPEAAKAVRKSVAGVYVAAKQGRIVIQKDGRRSYVTRAELERYVASCEAAPAIAATSAPPGLEATISATASAA
jgi:hypothetical protein